LNKEILNHPKYKNGKLVFDDVYLSRIEFNYQNPNELETFLELHFYEGNYTTIFNVFFSHANEEKYAVLADFDVILGWLQKHISNAMKNEISFEIDIKEKIDGRIKIDYEEVDEKDNTKFDLEGIEKEYRIDCNYRHFKFKGE